MASSRHRGFGLIELMVVLGLLCILLSLVLPALAGARSTSLAAVNMSNIRQMGVGLWAYAEANRDFPPTFGPPVWPPRGPWDLGFGPIGRGSWFEHSSLFSYAVTAELGNTTVANAAGSPTIRTVVDYRGVPACGSDFLLTHTMHAEPNFFTRDQRTGPDQFAPQHFSTIAFPSSKGILTQAAMYHYPEYGQVLACCMFDLPSPIVFADQSVSEHVVKRMPRGPFNPFAGGLVPPGVDPDALTGSAVMNTVNGILGRDR